MEEHTSNKGLIEIAKPSELCVELHTVVIKGHLICDSIENGSA